MTEIGYELKKYVIEYLLHCTLTLWKISSLTGQPPIDSGAHVTDCGGFRLHLFILSLKQRP